MSESNTPPITVLAASLGLHHPVAATRWWARYDLHREDELTTPGSGDPAVRLIRASSDGDVGFLRFATCDDDLLVVIVFRADPVVVLGVLLSEAGTVAPRMEEALAASGLWARALPHLPFHANAA